MKALISNPYSHSSLEKAREIARKKCGNQVAVELGQNMDAMLLYTLAENFGFTDEQLRLLHLYFILNTRMLGYKYEMQDCPSVVAEHFLVQHGIDFDKWVEADNKLWDDYKDKEEWVNKPLEDWNEFVKKLAEKRMDK